MSTTVNVLHLIHDLGFGGAQRLLADLVPGTDRRRFAVAVASLSAPRSSPFEAELRRNNIRLFYVDKRPGLDPRALSRLGAVFREVRPQVVHTHCHAMRYALPFVLAGRVRAAVHTVHNLADIDVGRPRWLTGLAYRSGVVPVAIGREVAASLARVFGIRNAPLIRNGICVSRFASSAADRGAMRKELGVDGEIVFLCAASLTPKKGHLVLIEALSRVVGKAPGVRLFLAGEGAQRLELEKRVALLGLGHAVRFLGARDDMPALLAASDVFVLSSFWEGMPLSVMEAMAAGRPVVCTAVGGSAEIVEDGVTGWLVPPNDPARLAEAMIEAVDPARRTPLGRRAAEIAAQQFGIEPMVRAYEALYESLLVKRAS